MTMVERDPALIASAAAISALLVLNRAERTRTPILLGIGTQKAETRCLRQTSTPCRESEISNLDADELSGLQRRFETSRVPRHSTGGHNG